jgi:hypothetical protein
VKRVNKKDFARFDKLHARLFDAFHDHPERQSDMIYRGDWRAIQWAMWWIRKHISDEKTASGAHQETKP